MNTRVDKRELTIDLCYRSTCTVKMAALIYDSHGIISWGWNHLGNTGMGTHAEEHAISRANRNRLKGASIIVVGFRKKNPVFALPCKEKCFPLIEKVGIRKIEFLAKTHWVELDLLVGAI